MEPTSVVGDSVESGTNQAASATTAPAATSSTPANPSAEADAAQANRNQGGGFGEWLGELWTKIQEFFAPIIDWIAGFFDPTTNDHAAAGSTPGAGGAGNAPQNAPDARTLEEARGAANGNAAAGTGADVASAAAPVTLPVASGPLVRGT